MEERRAVVRTRHACRTQYCPSSDLELREGRITNLSERGAGLLAREPHQEGEFVTVGFSLPRGRSLLTATGVVRWSGAVPGRGGWIPVGLDWLPLEETMQQRLQQFLEQEAPPRTSSRADAAPLTRTERRRIGILLGVLGMVVVGGLLAVWIGVLSTTNRQLEEAVDQRDSMISRLGQSGIHLSRELESARATLAVTAAEVTRLDHEAQRMGDNMDRLSADVQQMERSYLEVQTEREQLIQRVLDLEEERAAMTRRLAFLAYADEIRRVVRETIQTREDAAREAQRRVLAGTRLEADQRLLETGNRGFVIREGRPTIGASAGQIRVGEPQAYP